MNLEHSFLKLAEGKNKINKILPSIFKYYTAKIP
jgi:hypothetical protein